MKNLKYYIWWLIGVAACCMNAFLFGQIGGALFGACAVSSFLIYSLMTLGFYRRRKFQLLPPK